jgi:ABC-type multidrug transport system fused ATPase/permease subunit
VYDSFRKLTRDGQHIEKLWSTFDSLTPIRGYNSGSPFSLHKKDIEINSISYGYNETKVFDNFSLTIKR